MKKKILGLGIIVGLVMVMSVPVFADTQTTTRYTPTKNTPTAPADAPEYDFGLDYDVDWLYYSQDKTFATPTTSYDEPTYVQNVRRDKNASYYPPGYGTFSAEVPTDATNPYFADDMQTQATTKQVTSNQFYDKGTEESTSTMGRVIPLTTDSTTSTASSSISYSDSVPGTDNTFNGQKVSTGSNSQVSTGGQFLTSTSTLNKK